MQIKSLLIAAAAATTTLANPLLGLGQSTVPGYPWGLGSCLTRQQATWIVQQFKSVITNPNRDAAVKLASVLLDDSFSETSDSINVLAGHPQGSVTYDDKQTYLTGLRGAPPIPSMTDYDILAGCDSIYWFWLADGIGRDISPVKGFNRFRVNPKTGEIKTVEIEFNSIAWGRDIGWTCTPPPQ
ncbi:hypothetical protein LTS08_007064 [Lithohypha guttulata]|nr:hypothetical protein LTS08_007064 [Lithohypha guttulata]